MVGISDQGRNAEALFFDVVADSTGVQQASDGDALVTVDGEATAVEIKKCASESGAGTINQIRPIKFIPMVVYNPALDCWYVVPATELVRFATTKTRGQHTEIAFESMNLSLKHLLKWKCGSADLDEALRAAILFDRKHGKVKQAMEKLLLSIREQGRQQRDETAQLLSTVSCWELATNSNSE